MSSHLMGDGNELISEGKLAVDYTKISKEHVLSMDEIADDIKGLRIAFVNVFGVRGFSGSWTLIDAGLPFTAP